MKKTSIILGSIIALVVLSMWVPGTEAYERYNDGCQNCHGSFTGSTSPKGSVFPSDDKHTMHRNSSYMNTECDLCHTSGDGRDPFIGSSDGTGNNPGLGCTGCHADFGLRAHHGNADVTSCAGCHPDDSVPPPENTIPAYYGTADTNVDMPCNPDPQADINENWTIGDSEGIDNDGDGLYDANDPDCQAAAVCGDGTVDPSEDCDEGNANGTTTCGCQTDCTYPRADTAACDSGGEGCFIATAAYGSYWEPHVMTLRQFRDEHLLTNKLGTKFVEAYYKYSPSMASYIAEHDSLRSVTRIGLAPLVGFSFLAMNFGMMAALAVLFGVLTMFIGSTCLVVHKREAN